MRPSTPAAIEKGSGPCRTVAATAAAWLAAIPPAMLAGLAPAPAQANDRDLRGTPVPAAACEEISRAAALTENPWISGIFRLAGAGKGMQLRCPLPVNNVDLSGTSNDNDLTQIRVHYRDSDGFGAGAVVVVNLLKTAVSAAGAAESTIVCGWVSNIDGTGVTTAVKASKACAHDLAAGTFYHLHVQLQSGSGTFVQFLGVDFPQ